MLHGPAAASPDLNGFQTGSKKIQRCFVVEPGERPEGAGQLAEVVAGWRFAVQVAEPFSFAEPGELGRDDRGGALVGGLGELGVELERGRAFRVAQASGNSVEVHTRREELGG